MPWQSGEGSDRESRCKLTDGLDGRDRAWDSGYSLCACWQHFRAVGLRRTEKPRPCTERCRAPHGAAFSAVLLLIALPVDITKGRLLRLDVRSGLPPELWQAGYWAIRCMVRHQRSGRHLRSHQRLHLRPQRLHLRLQRLHLRPQCLHLRPDWKIMLQKIILRSEPRLGGVAAQYTAQKPPPSPLAHCASISCASLPASETSTTLIAVHFAFSEKRR
jgi:hypothetical protein